MILSKLSSRHSTVIVGNRIIYRFNLSNTQFFSTAAKPSKYSEAHKLANLRGPGDARPTALQIIKNDGLEGKMKDKVFIVTGASAGIGVETGRALAAKVERSSLQQAISRKEKRHASPSSNPAALSS